MGKLQGNWNTFPYRDTTKIEKESVIVVGGIPFRFRSWDDGDGMWGHIYFYVAPNMLNTGDNNGAYHTVTPGDYDGEDYTEETYCTHIATCCMSGIDMNSAGALSDYTLSTILHCAAANIVANLGYASQELAECIKTHKTSLVEMWLRYDDITD